MRNNVIVQKARYAVTKGRALVGGPGGEAPRNSHNFAFDSTQMRQKAVYSTDLCTAYKVAAKIHLLHLVQKSMLKRVDLLDTVSCV